MAGETVRIDGRDLARFAQDVFAAHGFGADDAATVANVLVWANLRGIDSHGVLRIPRYLAMVAEGNLNPTAAPTIDNRTAACFLVEADRAAGPVAMTLAMREAISRARDIGIAWGVVRATTHVAAIGNYALMAADADMAGITFSGSVPMMAYHGARNFSAATNPIAIAVPAANRPPVLLDMATAVASLGKMTDAQNRGVSIPEGWALDAEGNATTDPAAASISLPLGGPKGAGLSLMFECLSSLVAGNPIIAEAMSEARPVRHRQNAVVVALNLSVFIDVSEFKAGVDALALALKAQPMMPGTEEILMPGERGAGCLIERERDGIPVPQRLWDRLASIGDKAGVEAPLAVSQ